jgi:hypothetical protein
MKPSHLTRSLSRLLGLVLVTYLVGCAGTPPTPDLGDDGPPPPMVKQPPAPRGGGGTSPGCNGVTEAGTCADGVAEYCDVEADSLRRKDCKALGKSCVLDPSTGAKCETVGSGGGETDPGCEAGVTFDGSCGGTGGQTATWCDAFTQQTIVWDCAGDGLTCQTDTCETSGGTVIPGAFCCAAGGTPPPAQNPCPALGYEGECDGTGGVRWCNGDTLVEQTCTDGKTCQVDADFGIALCAAPPMSECETLGFEGRCVGGKPRWCSGGEVMEVTCGVGTQCEENGPDCAPGGGDAGAYCCAP